jgi:hypothetical protein
MAAGTSLPKHAIEPTITKCMISRLLQGVHLRRAV